MSDYSENTLIEQPAIDLFADLGWQTMNCFYEKFGPGGSIGRETSTEVVLVNRLRSVLVRLNPHLPRDALDNAIEASQSGSTPIDKGWSQGIDSC
ncbi:MAG: type I restriction endonuclease [Methanotrichaceae archaeon]|jgi:type I restriction enzyme R subunit